MEPDPVCRPATGSVIRWEAWITKLEQRMHRNKVIVALANKIARVAWKILTRPEEIYRWADA